MSNSKSNWTIAIIELYIDSFEFGRNLYCKIHDIE